MAKVECKLTDLIFKDDLIEWYRLLLDGKFSNKFKSFLLNNAENFTLQQIREIRYGLMHGLYEGKIMLYANPFFSTGQMREIRYGLEYGLNKEKVLVYAKFELNEEQMEESRLCLQDGIAAEVVKLYLDAKMPVSKMREEHLKFISNMEEDIIEDKMYERITNLLKEN